MRTLRLFMAAALLGSQRPASAAAQTLTQGVGIPLAPAQVVLPWTGSGHTSGSALLGQPLFSAPILPGLSLPQVRTLAPASAPTAVSAVSSVRETPKPVLLPAAAPVAVPVQALQAAETKPVAGKRWAAAQEDVSEIRTAFDGEKKGELRLSAVFENSRAVPQAPVEPVILEHQGRSPSGLRPASMLAPTEPGPQEPLPPAFKEYLFSQSLYALGQQAACILVPLLAFADHGAAFAVFSEMLSLGAIIPGSAIASRLVERYGPKRVNVAAIAAEGLLLLSLPILHFTVGPVPAAVFLAFNAARGFLYGAMRGVAEKQMLPSVVGQDDPGRLKSAGAAFFAVFSGMETLAAAGTALLLPAFGASGLTLAMGGAMVLSAVLLSRVALKKADEQTEEAPVPRKRTLDLAEALPYVFGTFAFLSFYSFFSPLIAYGVFNSAALGAWSVGAYTVGSLLSSGFMKFFAGASSKVRRGAWTAAAVASTLLYLWGSVLIPVPAVSAALAGLMGAGVAGAVVRWTARYQASLELDAQPREFKRLTVMSVGACLALAALLGALIQGLGLAMPVVLGIAAAAVSAAAAGYFLSFKRS